MTNKYHCQVENIGNSDKMFHVHVSGTQIHLCIKYEASKANGVVTMEINKGQVGQYAVSSAVLCIFTMLWVTIFILYHHSPLMYFLFGRHILFSVFMPITLEMVHTYV